MDTPAQPAFFTEISAYALAAVAMIGYGATTACNTFLPANAPWQDRTTFIWLVFDAAIHLTLEGSFLYMSVFGRQVNTSTGLLAKLWQEYARADFRWGFSDPAIVSLEILTVLGAGPLCLLVLYQMLRKDPARHYWIIVLCTGELYGGWMTFCPEWLTGSPNLDTSNVLFLWVYLVFMNILWVILPLWLMYDSYGHIVNSLRLTQAKANEKKAS